MVALNPADWGRVLQEPNLRKDLGGVAARRKMWGDRAAEMGGASRSAMDQLALALMAARDKQMADLAAADALRNTGRGGGGSGGRRSGGGGGGTAPGSLLADLPSDPANWFDQLAGMIGESSAPPAYDTSPSPIIRTFPSSLYGPNNVYAATPPNFGIGRGRQGRGFKPSARPLPKTTKYHVRLS